MSNIELEKRINKTWAIPNTYKNFPAPKLYKFKSICFDKGYYYRANCPVKKCEWDGLPGKGFNQHYARKHDPSQWRQHAKRVIKTVRKSR